MENSSEAAAALPRKHLRPYYAAGKAFGQALRLPLDERLSLHDRVLIGEGVEGSQEQAAGAILTADDRPGAGDAYRHRVILAANWTRRQDVKQLGRKRPAVDLEHQLTDRGAQQFDAHDSTRPGLVRRRDLLLFPPAII